ncbi:MAG: TetR/AcrR family transcriptional regulator [Thermoleophilaceae bacterium]
MADEKRPYRKRARAAHEEETRRRITESAVHLHGTVGPAHASISAIAEHAGVRRSTVYRHFPDEAALFAACSGHWRNANPPPDLAAWADIADPGERLRTALEDVYGWYRQTEPMLTNLLRDATAVPLVGELLGAGYGVFLAAAADVLMAGRRARGRARRRVQAAIGHALAVTTWRSLACEQGLKDPEAAELMCALVAAATLN